jgi:hypothetical protein
MVGDDVRWAEIAQILRTLCRLLPADVSPYGWT